MVCKNWFIVPFNSRLEIKFVLNTTWNAMSPSSPRSLATDALATINFWQKGICPWICRSYRFLRLGCAKFDKLKMAMNDWKANDFFRFLIFGFSEKCYHNVDENKRCVFLRIPKRQTLHTHSQATSWEKEDCLFAHVNTSNPNQTNQSNKCVQKSANKTKPKRIVRNVINTSKHGVKNDLCFAAERQIIGDEQANVNAKKPHIYT